MMTCHSDPLTSRRVVILMGVFNGAAHLDAQLQSIAAQTHGNWHLLCADDGSTDNSLTILSTFAQRHPGKVTLCSGPSQGFAANYMGLLAQLPPRCGPVCLADQDDIWLPDKLTRALQMLGKDDDKPTLYCGRQIYWYPATGEKIPAPVLSRPCAFRNALVQNVAAGNTIMLNGAASRMARNAARRCGSVYAHDWWLYLLISGAGGSVVFDNGPPQILYRQHRGNAIGAGRGLRRSMRRKWGVLRGEYAARMDQNITALLAIGDLLTPEARQDLLAFSSARRLRGLRRMVRVLRIRLYRQTRMQTFAFWGAAGLGRV